MKSMQREKQDERLSYNTGVDMDDLLQRSRIRIEKLNVPKKQGKMFQLQLG